MSNVTAKKLGAVRQDVLLITDPKMAPLVIGVDTDHKNKADHPDWDPRPIEALRAGTAAAEKLEALAWSIARFGMQEPIRARKDGPTNITTDGRRRNLAWRRSLVICKKEGWPPQPLAVWLVKDTDIGIAMRSRTANAHSLEDKPTHKAADVQRMIDAGQSVADVGIVYGMDEGTVKKLRRLLDCSAKVQTAVDEGQLSLSAAVRLAKLPRAEQDKELTAELAKAPAGKPVTVKRVEERLRERDGAPAKRTPADRIAKAVEMLRVAKDDSSVSPKDLMTTLEVELLAGSTPTPDQHKGECWRKPGHHDCAIKKIEALLAERQDAAA